MYVHIIPLNKLSSKALQGVIQEFVKMGLTIVKEDSLETIRDQ